MFLKEDIVIIKVQLQVVHLVVSHVEHDVYKGVIRDKFTTCIQHKATVAETWEITNFAIL